MSKEEGLETTKNNDLTMRQKFQEAIKLNDDKLINILAHEVMAKEEELEDQDLSDEELNHVVGACMRTGFPNFENDCRSPYEQ